MYVCSLPASYSFPSPASLSEGIYSCDSGIGVAQHFTCKYKAKMPAQGGLEYGHCFCL